MSIKDIVLIIHECNERAGLLVLCGAMWCGVVGIKLRASCKGLIYTIEKDILASLRTIYPFKYFLNFHIAKHPLKELGEIE